MFCKFNISNSLAAVVLVYVVAVCWMLVSEEGYAVGKLQSGEEDRSRNYNF